jgi:hypothetical protein
MQLIIDERADPRQRDGLVKILSGQETEDMATMWWVFGAMSPTKHTPLFQPISFDVDVDARRARLDVPGLVLLTGEPIRDAVTGAERRVRIDFPESFEFRLGEVARGTSKTSGTIALDLKDTYGVFAHLHLSHKGRLNLYGAFGVKRISSRASLILLRLNRARVAEGVLAGLATLWHAWFSVT